MTRTPQLVLVIVMALLVVSCGKPGEETQSNSQPEGEDPSSIGADVSTSDHGLSLNGAEKWQMDAHTRAMFDRMTASFEEGRTETGDSESIKMTGVKIRSEIDELIQGCTMTGEAHDQLHKYLVAYIPAVERMAEEGTKSTADSVQELLELYPNYFQ